MSIGKRLAQAIEGLGIKTVQFCRECEINYRTVQQYIHDERTPSAEILGKISAHSRIDINWLLTGQGEMYRDNLAPKSQEQAVPLLPDPTPEDPLARRKAAVKMMMEQLVDQIDDPQGLDEIQVDLQKIKRTQEMEREIAELRRKTG